MRALAIRRGAPIGELGYAQQERPPLRRPPADEALHLVSGYLDDARVAVGPDHRLYGMASYAYAYEELWTDDEHRDYWSAHLRLWPAPTGRKSNRESLAYAIVQAEILGVPASDVAAVLGRPHDDLRDRNILDLAQHCVRSSRTLD